MIPQEVDFQFDKQSEVSRAGTGITPLTDHRLQLTFVDVPLKPLTRLRKLCLTLPQAHEVEAWGAPTFRVKNKLFAMHAAAGNHHTEGREAVWIKAAPGNQAIMVGVAPKKFFVPPYVGPSGWVGVWLDRRVNWKEVEDLLRDSWRLVAPKRLVAAHDLNNRDR